MEFQAGAYILILDIVDLHLVGIALPRYGFVIAALWKCSVRPLGFRVAGAWEAIETAIRAGVEDLKTSGSPFLLPGRWCLSKCGGGNDQQGG